LQLLHLLMVYRRFVSICVIVFAICPDLFSQFGAGISMIKPVGDFNYLFKPSHVLEIFYDEGDPEDYFHYGISTGFCYMVNRFDTIPVYISGYDGNKNALLPGVQSVKNYYIVPVDFNCEFRVPGLKVSPFGGLDIVANCYSYDYFSNIPGYVRREEDISGVIMSVMSKTGAVLQLNDQLELSLGLGKSIGRYYNTRDQVNWWKIFFSVKYSR
jgi:hypothetical protein